METENAKVKDQSDSLNRKTELKQRCFDYSIRLIRFISALPETQVTRILFNQVVRSGTSIGANITEAKSSSSKREFIRYFEIALRSANETKYWFGLLQATLDIGNDEARFLVTETEELSRIIAASILTMKDRR